MTPREERRSGLRPDPLGWALVLVAGAVLWGCSPEPVQPEKIPVTVPAFRGDTNAGEGLSIGHIEITSAAPRHEIASGVFYPRDLVDGTNLVWRQAEPTWGAAYDHETNTLNVGRWGTVSVVGRVFELPGGYRVTLPPEAVEVPR